MLQGADARAYLNNPPKLPLETFGKALSRHIAQAAVVDKDLAEACGVGVRTVKNWIANKSLPSGTKLKLIEARLWELVSARRRSGEIEDQTVTLELEGIGVATFADPSLSFGDLWGAWFERAHKSITSDEREAFDRVAFSWDALVQALGVGWQPARVILLAPMRTKTGRSGREFQIIRLKKRSKLGCESLAIVRFADAYRLAVQMNYAPSVGRPSSSTARHGPTGHRSLWLPSIGKESLLLVQSEDHEYADVSDAPLEATEVLYVEDVGT